MPVAATKPAITPPDFLRREQINVANDLLETLAAARPHCNESLGMFPQKPSSNGSGRRNASLRQMFEA